MPCSSWVSSCSHPVGRRTQRMGGCTVLCHPHRGGGRRSGGGQDSQRERWDPMQNLSRAFGSDGVNSRPKELWGEALGVTVDSADGRCCLCCLSGTATAAPDHLLCRTGKDNLGPGASSPPAALPLPSPWSSLCLGLHTEGCPGAEETPSSDDSLIFLLAFTASTGHLLEWAA